jgi:ribosomal protein S18 acetylase RimI-like enzyme
VFQYRNYRNGDPPGLVDLWNTCFTGRGAAFLRGSTLLDYFTLSKPYFDPAGLILAIANGRTVGFAHSGFGPDASGTALDTSTGVVCAIGVLPAHRRQGVGTELLRRCEEFLRSRGARRILAGPVPPLNPFTFALYGGADSCGFLASDPLARTFLEKRSYRPGPARLVLQRPLDSAPGVADGRFAAFRQRYEIVGGPRHGLTWYQEAVAGPVELHEYKLTDRTTTRAVSRAGLWEMETFGQRWNEHAVGLIELETVPDLRRQGLAKFLLSQLLRHLHEQFFTLVEAHAPADDAAVGGLLKLLGFARVDEGFIYTRDGG